MLRLPLLGLALLALQLSVGDARAEDFSAYAEEDFVSSIDVTENGPVEVEVEHGTLVVLELKKRRSKGAPCYLLVPTTVERIIAGGAIFGVAFELRFKSTVVTMDDGTTRFICSGEGNDCVARVKMMH